MQVQRLGLKLIQFAKPSMTMSHDCQCDILLYESVSRLNTSHNNIDVRFSIHYSGRPSSNAYYITRFVIQNDLDVIANEDSHLQVNAQIDSHAFGNIFVSKTAIRLQTYCTIMDVKLIIQDMTDYLNRYLSCSSENLTICPSQQAQLPKLADPSSFPPLIVSCINIK